MRLVKGEKQSPGMGPTENTSQLNVGSPGPAIPLSGLCLADMPPRVSAGTRSEARSGRGSAGPNSFQLGIAQRSPALEGNMVGVSA